jgi:hypothetical protein
MKTWIWAVALALGLALPAASAFAAPVTWNVTGTFVGGGTVAGSFVYDADTNAYSSINITTTAGSEPGAFYTATSPLFTNSPTQFVAVTAAGRGAGNPRLVLEFSPSLNNAGGVRTLDGEEGTCVLNCNSFGSLPRPAIGSANTAVPATVPTMSEWTMILLGVLLAGGAALTIQRRRKA